MINESIIPAGYFSQPWHLMELSYLIQHSSWTLPFVAGGKCPPHPPNFIIQSYPNWHNYCVLQGYHASVWWVPTNLFQLLNMYCVLRIAYCIAWTLNSLALLLYLHYFGWMSMCVYDEGCDSHGFLLKGSCFLSLLAFFLLFLLRNLSSFPAFFSSLYFWASSRCFWVAWGRRTRQVGQGRRMFGEFY